MTSSNPNLTPDPTYHFSDGSLDVTVESTKFKLHESLLARHCRSLDNLSKASISHVRVFLAHLYHDKPLTPESDLEDIASILRITHSSEGVNYPVLHDLAKKYLVAQFPSGAYPFTHLQSTEDIQKLERALMIAKEFEILEVQKGVLYTLVTTHHFHSSDATSTAEDATKIDTPTASELSPQTVATCTRLLDSLINALSPLLFTPPGTSHMACTDIVAGIWMDVAISPTLSEEEGCALYKPLETLERLRTEVDWVGKGVCEECVEEKRDEWKEEMEAVWSQMDGWLG